MKKTIFSLVIAIAAFAHADYPPIFMPIVGYEKTTDNITLIQGLVDQVIVSHNARFNSQGQIISSPEQDTQFSNLQKDSIAQIRSKGGYKLLFPITNSVMSSKNGQAFFIVNENNQLLAFSFEDASSRAAADDSILRIRPVKYLTQVQSIIGMDNQPVLVLESKTTDWSRGGEVRFYCLMDKKKKKYSVMKLQAALDATNKWNLYYGTSSINKMHLKLWVNIFSANGGVQDVMINDTLKVSLEPVAQTEVEALGLP